MLTCCPSGLEACYSIYDDGGSIFVVVVNDADAFYEPDAPTPETLVDVVVIVVEGLL